MTYGSPRIAGPRSKLLGARTARPEPSRQERNDAARNAGEAESRKPPRRCVHRLEVQQEKENTGRRRELKDGGDALMPQTVVDERLDRDVIPAYEGR